MTTKGSDNPFPSILLDENTEPTAPGAGLQRVYIDSTSHHLSRTDSAGAEVDIESAGDVTAHTGDTTDAHDASAISFSPVGTIAATDVQAAIAEVASEASSNLAGQELDYVEKTSPTSITATTEATANTVVTGGAVTYDGSTAVIIEFYSPSVENPNAADGGILLALYDGSSSIGLLSQQNTSTADSTNRWPLLARRRLTPSAAAHTYSVRAFVSSGTGSVFGGAGGAAAYMPAFIRQTKV